MSESLFITNEAGDRDAGLRCAVCQTEVARGTVINTCNVCGSIHHASCWQLQGGCGSFSCAPGRRTLRLNESASLKISAKELAQAVPLSSGRATSFIPAPVLSSPLPRTNRLAIASLVAALAGIPFFGVITGLVAIVLGSLALGSLRNSRQKGVVLAISGIFLGLVDAIGWVIFLTGALSRPGPDLHVVDFETDASAFESVDPKLVRPMRANVVIESHASGILPRVATGSGVILDIQDSEALIITNRHVIDGDFDDANAASVDHVNKLGHLNVRMIGQLAQPGRVVWIAPDGVDLALVRVACVANQPEATRWEIGRSPRVGDAVFAIGNPYQLNWTHTQGTISQFRSHQKGNRQIRIIQTQAAINPGNSGGGLYDQEGYLIGIITWTSDKRVAEGIGMAISIDTLRDLAPPDLKDAFDSKDGPADQANSL